MRDALYDVLSLVAAFSFVAGLLLLAAGLAGI